MLQEPLISHLAQCWLYLSVIAGICWTWSLSLSMSSHSFCTWSHGLYLRQCLATDPWLWLAICTVLSPCFWRSEPLVVWWKLLEEWVPYKLLFLRFWEIWGQYFGCLSQLFWVSRWQWQRFMLWKHHTVPIMAPTSICKYCQAFYKLIFKFIKLTCICCQVCFLFTYIYERCLDNCWILIPLIWI